MKKRSNILILGLFLSISSLPAMIIHGLGHLTMAFLLGVNVKWFAPFPHLEEGRISFLCVGYGNITSLSDAQRGLLYIGGNLFTFGLAATLFTLLKTASFNSQKLRPFLEGLIFWCLLDVLKLRDIYWTAVLVGLNNVSALFLTILVFIAVFTMFTLNLDHVLKEAEIQLDA